MSKPKKRAAARALRKQGHTLPEIAKKLEVSKGSVSLWVRDIKLSAEQQRKASLRKADRYKRSARTKSLIHRERRQCFQQEGRVDARRNDPLHIMGCMLYWGEGGKNRNSIKLANTDVELLQLFTRFLHECYGVSKTEVGLYIRAYSNNGLTTEQITEFWLEKLGLTRGSVRSIVMDGEKRRKSGLKKKIHPYGICQICVNRTDLVQRIFGAIQEYGGFNNDAWVN